MRQLCCFDIKNSIPSGAIFVMNLKCFFARSASVCPEGGADLSRDGTKADVGV